MNMGGALLIIYRCEKHTIVGCTIPCAGDIEQCQRGKGSSEQGRKQAEMHLFSQFCLVQK